MNSHVEFSRDAWIAIIRLAVVVSTAAAVFAIGMSLAGDVSEATIVIPVIVVGFAASWTMTGRMHAVQVQSGRVPPARSRAVR